jgi:CRP-like cAMP-binding protein
MRTSLEDLSMIIREIALFRALAEHVLDDVVRSSEVLNLAKGKRIYAAGDRPRALYHVMSGHLKVSVSSMDGSEKVIEILEPQQLFGVAEIFGGAPCVSSVETVTPVVLLAIGREGYCVRLRRTPRYRGACSVPWPSDSRPLSGKLPLTASSREVASLDYLLRLGGASVESGRSVVLQLIIPKHVLAARMGITPETLSRIFRELSDAGMIKVNGKQLTLTEAFCRRYALRIVLHGDVLGAPSCARASQTGSWHAPEGARRLMGVGVRGV